MEKEELLTKRDKTHNQDSLVSLQIYSTYLQKEAVQ